LWFSLKKKLNYGVDFFCYIHAGEKKQQPPTKKLNQAKSQPKQQKQSQPNERITAELPETQ